MTDPAPNVRDTAWLYRHLLACSVKVKSTPPPQPRMPYLEPAIVLGVVGLGLFLVVII